MRTLEVIGIGFALGFAFYVQRPAHLFSRDWSEFSRTLMSLLSAGAQRPSTTAIVDFHSYPSRRARRAWLEAFALATPAQIRQGIAALLPHLLDSGSAISNNKNRTMAERRKRNRGGQSR